MRKSKITKQKKDKLNKKLKAEGRTKQQRKNIMMRNAIESFNGEVIGLTLKDKYQHMHKQIAFRNAEQRRLEEEKAENDLA